jgi:hypothetical protein
VDLNLYVAATAYPDIPWRILNQVKHSTVWNGDYDHPVLFDANFLALEVPASQALRLAFPGRKLQPGQYLKWYAHLKQNQARGHRAWATAQS